MVDLNYLELRVSDHERSCCAINTLVSIDTFVQFP